MRKREVPFLPMGGIYDEAEIDAADRIVRQAAARGGDFFPLPEENLFQKAFANHEGARNAVAVNSCGTALDCCMMALDIGSGDEVITTPLTFVCTAGTALGQGADVVFADVDPVTLNLDPASVAQRITPRTKAIIPVHYTGLPVDIDSFSALSKESGIPIIFDAAHAVGARYHDRPIGGAGMASCYSFQSNKNMTCLGEGGAVTTNDDAFAEVVRQKKTFGYVYGPKNRVASIGYNYRMTKAQYAVGLTQLEKIDRVIELRSERMVKMFELLDGIDEIHLPAGHGPNHGSHLFVIRLDTDRVGFSRDQFKTYLKEEYAIGTVVHYPAVWEWEAIAALGYTSENARCPVAEKACSQVLSLPIFPDTEEDDLKYVAWGIKESISKLRGQAI